MGESREVRARLLSAVPSDRKFYLNIKLSYCEGGRTQGQVAQVGCSVEILKTKWTQP